MAELTENELSRLCEGIRRDREIIIKHNPIGSERETLLWMLMSVLISYLSLGEKEIPCFPGETNEQTYIQAVKMIVGKHSVEKIDTDEHIEQMLA